MGLFHAMLFVQMLLPRFLVLEGLVLIHSLGRAGGCLKQAERQVGDLVNEEEEEGGGGSRSRYGRTIGTFNLHVLNPCTTGS